MVVVVVVTDSVEQNILKPSVKRRGNGQRGGEVARAAPPRVSDENVNWRRERRKKKTIERTRDGGERGRQRAVVWKEEKTKERMEGRKEKARKKQGKKEKKWERCDFGGEENREKEQKYEWAEKKKLNEKERNQINEIKRKKNVKKLSEKSFKNLIVV